MPPTTIENPVINSPFVEPAKHFRVVDGLVSGEIEPKRRPSEFFVPVAKPKKASAQLALQFGGGTRQQPNEIVNEVRQAVARWRRRRGPEGAGGLRWRRRARAGPTRWKHRAGFARSEKSVRQQPALLAPQAPRVEPDGPTRPMGGVVTVQRERECPSAARRTAPLTPGREGLMSVPPARKDERQTCAR